MNFISSKIHQFFQKNLIHLSDAAIYVFDNYKKERLYFFSQFFGQNYMILRMELVDLRYHEEREPA